MTERQMMIENLAGRLNHFSDVILASLVPIFNAIEVAEDEARYITYGKDDTEHVLSNPVNARRLRDSIRDIEQGNTIKVTLEELEALAR